MLLLLMKMLSTGQKTMGKVQMETMKRKMQMKNRIISLIQNVKMVNKTKISH